MSIEKLDNFQFQQSFVISITKLCLRWLLFRRYWCAHHIFKQMGQTIFLNLNFERTWILWARMTLHFAIWAFRAASGPFETWFEPFKMTQFQNFRFREIIWFICLEIWWTPTTFEQKPLLQISWKMSILFGPNWFVDVLFLFYFSTYVATVKKWVDKQAAGDQFVRLLHVPQIWQQKTRLNSSNVHILSEHVW